MLLYSKRTIYKSTGDLLICQQIEYNPILLIRQQNSKKKRQYFTYAKDAGYDMMKR